MITSLRTINFQKLGATELSFGPGLNLITGPNWAGKSTVLRAILYALGGGRAVRVKTEDLPATGAKSFEVVLVLDGRYEVVRGTKRVLVIDTQEEATVAAGHAAVTDWVAEYLGLTLKDFQSFRVTEQGEPDALLRAGSAALADYIERASGADVIDRALAWLDRDQIATKAFLAGAGGAREQAAELNAALEAARAQAHASLEAMEEARAVLASLKDPLVQWRAYVEQLQDLDRVQREAQRAFETLERQRVEARERLDALVITPDPSVELAAARTELEALLEKRLVQQGAERAYALAKGAYERALAEEAALERELEHLREGEPVAEIEAARAAVRARQSELNAQRAYLESAVCPTCHRPFEPEQDPRTLHERHEGVLAQLATLDFEERALTTRLTSATTVAQRLAWVLNDLKRLQATRLEPPAPLPAAAESSLEEEPLETWRGRVAHLEHAHRDWLSASALAHELALQLERAETALAALKVPDAVAPGTLESARESLRELEARSVQWGQEFAARQERVWASAREVERLEHEARAAGERLERLADVERRDALAARLVRVLRKNRAAFLQETWALLLGYASNFIAAASSGDMTQLLRADTGGFQFVEAGVERPIEVASGMQTAILGVALKLALGAAIGGSARILLLDEVTAAGSPENSAALVGLLKGQAGQVILVTHRAEDAALADRVISL